MSRFDNLGNTGGENFPVRIDFDGTGNFEFINLEKSFSLEVDQDSDTIEFKKHFPTDNPKAERIGQEKFTATIECIRDIDDPVQLKMDRAVKNKKEVVFQLYNVTKSQPLYIGSALITREGEEFSAEDSSTITYKLNIQGELHQYGVNENFIIRYMPGEHGAFDPQLKEAEYNDLTPGFNGAIEPISDKYEFKGWNNGKGIIISDDDIKTIKVRGDIVYTAVFQKTGGGATTTKKVVLKIFNENPDGSRAENTADVVEPILPDRHTLLLNLGDTIGDALYEKFKKTAFSFPSVAGYSLSKGYIELYDKDPEQKDPEGKGPMPSQEIKNQNAWNDFINNYEIDSDMWIYLIYVKR